jgi:hypothetical protein
VDLNHSKHIIAEWLEISCAKRREIIRDGLTAASMQQIFAPEISSHSVIIDNIDTCS